MATDDQQILVAGTAPAPASFLVPGNGQIRPKAVRAVFDGTAAAAFLPVLQILSDGGVLVAECVGAQVAAGASAAVSFFPRVSAAQSSSKLAFQHNDVLVASEPAADFEDTVNLTWGIVDDPANSRVKITPSIIAGSGIVDVQTFTPPGGTWTKPASAKVVAVFMGGSGGGGGGGAASPAGAQVVCPGSGGGGAAVIHSIQSAAVYGAHETVTVGAGGLGGNAGNSGAGSPGGDGASTTFGQWLRAGGGGGGRGGTTGAGSSILGGAGGAVEYDGVGSTAPVFKAGDNASSVGSQAPGNQTSGGVNGTNAEWGGGRGGGAKAGQSGNLGGSAIFGGAGGGGGGSSSKGGDGGTSGAYTAGGGGAGGAAGGGNGTDGTSQVTTYAGSGGGGGAGNNVLPSVIGNGGKGGLCCGGGGGSSRNPDPGVAGAGGNGGDGFCVVASW